MSRKWSDGRIHHPYELVYNGHGMLCDTGCGAFVPCQRKGVICDGCGNTTPVARPRVVPWWFHPEVGNIYLDDKGNPIGITSIPPEAPLPAKPADKSKDAPAAAAPVTPETPAAPAAPEAAPAVPAAPAPQAAPPAPAPAPTLPAKVKQGRG